MTCCHATLVGVPSATVAEHANPGHEPTQPALDVIETAEEFRLDLDVPGIGKDDVELGFESGLLVIRAHLPARENTPERYHVREHARTGFARRIRLGDTIDVNAITAEVARGVLTVHLPKVADAKPRRIEVRQA